MGLASLALSDAERAVVLLGDQPRLSAAQLGTILAAPQDAARPFVVPRYGGAPGNPVLLERAAWPFAARLGGDTGMAQLFRNNPEMVRYVDVEGTNPDIDTRRDLADLRSAPQS
jgi:molybdenum cofactor cytidylyltransferase